MPRTNEFGRARAVVFVSLFALGTTVWMAQAAQQNPTPDPGQNAASSNFTSGAVTTLKAEGRLSYYVFSPGGRTKWHTHEGGQLLLTEEGVARTQQRGKPTQDLRPGESTWSPPGVTHWHGSAPGNPAKLYQIARGTTTWLEPVSDEDYNTSPKAR